MKRIVPNLEAMKARLEKNKESSRREKISNQDNPILKVDGPGKYNFRATYYPHSEDPAAEPFPMRHYHFGIPGGILYCPQKNVGELCALCDFVWERMKESKGDKEKVSTWAKKLPKARLWIPGKLRGREEEGFKLFSIGTAEDRMSKSHEKIFEWFFNEETEAWLSPEKSDQGGFDVVIEYEKYEVTKAKMLNAEFGFKDLDLARSSTVFGGDFEQFMSTIPDIDNSELDVLKSYSKKTSQDALDALTKWLDRLKSDTQKSSSKFKTVEVDTSADEEDEFSVSHEDVKESKESTLRARLAKFNA